jgi:hypothetical protein
MSNVSKRNAVKRIVLGLSSQKTRPLPSNGYHLLLRIRWNVFT